MILNLLLAFLAGGVLDAVFPPHNITWLAPLAPALLIFVAAREQRWPWRFLLGYIAGIHCWFGLCSWIATTLARFGGVSHTVAWLLFVLFCLAKAVQMGLFTTLAGPITGTRFALPGVAALWVVLEWTHPYTGFEWLHLGNAGSAMSVPLRLAPITGVWGLSFVFVLMGAAIANIALRRPRLRIAWLLLLVGLPFLPNVPPVQRGAASAIVAQPNLADDIPWTDDLLQRTLRELSMLSLSPVLGRETPPDLILWPEVPAPFYDYDSGFVNTVETIAKTAHAAVITGVVGRASDGAPLNSALLIGPDGRPISRYDKVNLVPFGEFVPWPFGFITKKVSTEAGDFEAGRAVVVSRIDGHKVGTFICYESVFPTYVRRFVASGAEVLFNLSNDSWFGNTAARYQHLLIVRMRAAENQRWIVRATNDGISASIDPGGRLLRSAAEHEELAARFPYSYRTNLTLYTRFGDWFVALCALIAAASLTSAVLPKHRRP